MLPKEIADCIKSFRVEPPAAFWIAGDRYAIDAADSDATDLLHARLRELLYARLHCRFPVRQEYWNTNEDRDFVNSLAAAHEGGGSWESGWVAGRPIDATQRWASRQGVRFRVFNDDLRVTATALKEGADCSVRIPRQQLGLLPGFFLALGERAPASSDGPRVRVYWNVRADGAAPLVAQLTRRLNSERIPFWLKLVTSPGRCRRTDTAVLYLPRSAFVDAHASIAAAHSVVMSYLRPGVSAFAKDLAPGVGVGEDPGDGTSFGEQRSRLLSDALLSNDFQGATSDAERVEAVERALTSAGYKAEVLHLDPGSYDIYDVLPADA